MTRFSQVCALSVALFALPAQSAVPFDQNLLDTIAAPVNVAPAAQAGPVAPIPVADAIPRRAIEKAVACRTFGPSLACTGGRATGQSGAIAGEESPGVWFTLAVEAGETFSATMIRIGRGFATLWMGPASDVRAMPGETDKLRFGPPMIPLPAGLPLLAFGLGAMVFGSHRSRWALQRHIRDRY